MLKPMSIDFKLVEKALENIRKEGAIPKEYLDNASQLYYHVLELGTPEDLIRYIAWQDMMCVIQGHILDQHKLNPFK